MDVLMLAACGRSDGANGAVNPNPAARKPASR